MDPSFRVDVTLATSENDTYEILKEAKEMFRHGDIERSGHHFIQVFRIIRGEYDQDCVRYTREFFQCTVHKYSQLFAKKLQDTRKLEAQLLHDAAMAYFVDRRKRSKARDTPFHNPGKPIWKGPYEDAELLRLSVKQQDVSLALPYYCSNLYTSGEVKSGGNTWQAGVSVANIIPATDVIGRAIDSAENSVDIACTIARYCIFEYSGIDAIPSWMMSDLSWIILHSIRDQIWVKNWALPTLKKICQESEKDGNSWIKWFLKSKEIAESDPLRLTINP